METNRNFAGPCKIAFWFFLSLLSILPAGCATSTDYQSLMKNNATSDNSMAAGYIDGCDSGLSTNPDMSGRMYFQDMIRYNSDKSYATGWDKGLKKCSR